MDEYVESGDEEEGYQVLGPSGATLSCMNEGEVTFFEDKRDRYLSDNHFTNVTDLMDVDRMLMMELMCWRWGNWLSKESDYWGNQVDLEALKKAINDYSKELRLLKKSLGIDKAQRDKERGESVAEYIENLRIRAKEFGINRNNQAVKAITLFQELSSLITYHDNCTVDERREQDIEEHDIIQWIREIAIPEFDEIDRQFRQTSQKYWVRGL